MKYRKASSLILGGLPLHLPGPGNPNMVSITAKQSWLIIYINYVFICVCPIHLDMPVCNGFVSMYDNIDFNWI